jgi:hypothetical protein
MTVIEPDREPPTPTAAARKSHVTQAQVLIAWLVLVLGLVLLVVGTSPFWAPGFAPLLPWGQRSSVTESAPTLEISRLQAELDAADATLKQHAGRLSRLEGDIAASKQQAGQISQLGDLQAALKDQAARLAQLEARPTTAAGAAPPPVPVQSPQTAAAIKSLQDQIAKLSAGTEATGTQVAKLQAEIQKAVAANTAHRASLLAIANLRIAVEGPAPFTAELAAATALAGDDAKMKKALESLEADATSGLPTLAMLAERFDRSVAPAILRAPRVEAHADWWQQIRARVERLVVIRRIGPDAPTPRDQTEATVAKADAALGAGDLSAAVAALDDLSGDAGKAAALWLAQAKRRVAAEALLAQLWQDKVAKSEDRL